MNVLDRLKIELNHKDYFTDDEYTMYLAENSLTATDTYNKTTMQRNLLLTVVDILEAISNDIDIMRKVEDTTTNMSVSECSKYLEQRIERIKDKIATLPDPNDDTGEDSNVFMLFTSDR
jgi:chaperonin cofactor prefoldin